MHRRGWTQEAVRLFVAVAGCVLISSCSTGALQNLFSASTDFQSPNALPVSRALQVGFINNTPFRAIFTFGAYNPLEKDTLPTASGQLRLEGNSSSAAAVQPCRKVFSVGGDELIRLIDTHRESPAINITDERALVRGVNFSGAPIGDPLAAEPTQGTAAGVQVLDGVDFSCARTDIRHATGGGLLLFTFEQDAASPGGFRIDFSFVPE